MVILTHEDKADYELLVRAGRLVGFAINYRAFIAGDWREVLRYDTSHGQLHRHRFWAADTHADLERKSGAVQADFTEAFESAKQDVVANWRQYRSLMR